jgi:hypothetical protein
VRAPDGSFTTFDVPGSEAPFGTTGIAINPSGAIVGGYFGGSMFHGFVRAPNGSFTTVDPTGSASTGIGAIRRDDLDRAGAGRLARRNTAEDRGIFRHARRARLSDPEAKSLS